MTTATLSEFAALLGVKPSYVTKLRQRGRLVLTDDGMVDVAASKLRIEETKGKNRDDVRARHAAARELNNGASAPAAPESPAPPLPEIVTPPATAEEGGELPAFGSRAYWERREAAARAETREVELAKLKGELVETEAVQAAGAEAGTTIRTVLENLADQLAPVLAAESDEPSVHRILREQMDTALHDIIARLEASTHALTEEKAA